MADGNVEICHSLSRFGEFLEMIEIFLDIFRLRMLQKVGTNPTGHPLAKGVPIARFRTVLGVCGARKAFFDSLIGNDDRRPAVIARVLDRAVRSNLLR